MAVLASGTSIIGRQVLVSRTASPIAFSVGIFPAVVAYRYRGTISIEHSNADLSPSTVQAVTKKIWWSGVSFIQVEDAPDSVPRQVVAYWNEAGIPWKVSSLP